MYLNRYIRNCFGRYGMNQTVVNVEGNTLENIELESKMIVLKFLHSTPDMAVLLVPASFRDTYQHHFTLHYITYLLTYSMEQSPS